VKKKLLVSVSVIVVLAGAALAGPSFVDWNKYKPQIVTQLHAATGHDYALGGDLQFAILPTPHLRLQQLAISAPKEQGGARILSLDEASVSVALMPLLGGHVVISSVELVKPDIDVSVNANGTASWMTPVLDAKLHKEKPATPEAQQAAAQEDKFGAISLDNIRVKEGHIKYADRRSGSAYEIGNITFTLSGGSLSGPFDLSGNAVYRGQDVAFKAKTGKLGPEAESLSLDASADFSGLKSGLDFSGVLTLKPQVEAQGQAHLRAADLAAFLAALTGGQPNAALAHNVDLKGMLTYTPDTVAFKDMSLVYAGLEAGGTISAAGLQARAPLNVTATLATKKPLALDTLLPASGGGAAPAGGKGKAAPPAQFLPQSLTLPVDLALKATITAPQVTYKGASFSNATIQIAKDAKTLGAHVTARGQGNGALDADTVMSFASVTKNTASGAVTLADPTLAVTAKAQADDGMAFIGALLPPAQKEKAGALLADGFNTTMKLAVTPKRVAVDAAAVEMLSTRLDFSGAYDLRAHDGRDMLTVAVQSKALDIDALMKKISGGADKNAAAAPAAKPAAVKDAVKALALPFDLNVSADLENATLQGLTYDSLRARGSLAGNMLKIDQVAAQDRTGNKLLVAGNIGDVKALKQIDLSAQVTTPQFDKFAQSFGVNTANFPKQIGKADILGQFKGDADKLSFIANVRALNGTLKANGTAADILGKPALSDMTVELTHPNYAEIVRIFNPAFNGAVTINKNLHVFASMQNTGNVYKFTGLNADIGPMNLSGDVSADMGGARPSIAANLTIGNCPLDALMGKGAGGVDANGQPVPAQRKSAGDARWSRDAINTDWMRKFDVSLKATASKFSYGGWLVTNAVIDGALKDGALTVKQLDGNMYGGKVALKGDLKSSDKPRQPVALTGDVSMDHVQVEQFVTAFSGARLVKASGDISFSSNIAATGLSPAALIFDLHGAGKANGKDLIFEGFDLARLARAVGAPSSSMTQNFSELMNASMAGGSTRFDTLDGVFDIKEGVINFTRLDLIGAAADIATTGNISLPLWTIDMTNTITLKGDDAKDAPPLSVSFKGPLDNPGQTFGQQAMQMFMQKQLEGLILNPLQKKMDAGKGVTGNKVIDQILPGLLGGGKAAAPAAQPPAPAAATGGAIPGTSSAVRAAPPGTKIIEPTPRDIAPVTGAPAPAPEPAATAVTPKAPQPAAAKAVAPAPAEEAAAEEETTGEDDSTQTQGNVTIQRKESLDPLGHLMNGLLNKAK
jgi:uncharacterized protein involved in outer membrane biogenesis